MSRVQRKDNFLIQTKDYQARVDELERSLRILTNKFAEIPHARLSTSGHNINNSEWTAITGLSADWDNSNFLSPDNSTVIIPEKGLYTVIISVPFGSSAVGDRGIRVLVDGTIVPFPQLLISSVKSSATPTRAQLVWQYRLNAQQSLNFQVWQNSGGILSFSSAVVMISKDSIYV